MTRPRRRNAGNLATLHEPIRLLRDRDLALVHLHTAGRIGGAVRTAMRLTGRPYVISIHGPRFAGGEFLAADTARRLAGLVDLGRPLGALFGARRVFHDAARVLCFHREERDATAALVGDRAVWMDHGVDRVRFAAGDVDRARARWPELGDAPVVLLVGRLCEQKNQRLAIEAFAVGAPPTARLVLAGAQTDHGYLETVLATARQAGVADRVHILGNLAPSAIPDLFARAALVLAPSLHEAFGLVVLEAWAASRAVVFARRAGLADLADALGPTAPALAGLDVASWAEAIRVRLSSPRQRQVEAAEGAALVARRYSWDRVASRLADIYGEVLAERQGRA
ncbi:MAG: glycosyltransferase family 4 protein [Proteobacteria bacterium]|nr:glycosyltransferase family 4 protein [Pseudomonadota bacterium]